MAHTKMLIPVGKEADEDEYLGSDQAAHDFMALAFNEKRHMESIEGSKTVTQTWRMKERVMINVPYISLFT